MIIIMTYLLCYITLYYVVFMVCYPCSQCHRNPPMSPGLRAPRPAGRLRLRPRGGGGLPGGRRGFGVKGKG